MSFNIKLSYLFALLLVVVMTSCEEFEDFNENPNEPTEVTPDVLMTSALRSSMDAMVTESFLLSNNIAQLTAKTLRLEVGSYNWNAFPTVWEALYGSLTDVHAVENQAIAEGNEQLQGAAVVLKAWIYSTLTNAYGNVPYSEAIDGAGLNFTPVYDEQSAIYTDLLLELERANGLLGGEGSISGDILLGGDAEKWQKLCNSLRLRLIMTASNQLANAASQFSNALNSNIMTSNADNATLTYLGGFPNQYPLVPLKTGDFDAVAISSSIVNNFNNYNDPRLLRYARPDNDDFNDPTSVVGADNGLNTEDCSKIGSRLGVQYWNDPATTQADDLNLPMAEGIIMTYAEVEFLIAEAAAKGWITEDVEAHYKNGIQAAMDYYQVDYAPFGWADFEDFYSNSGVAYDAVTDIWEQKWVNSFFHGFEPYFELRRWYFESGMSWDGIPFLDPPCSNVTNDQLPLRFLYPTQEQSLNTANYNAAVEALGGSNDQNATMWLVE